MCDTFNPLKLSRFAKDLDDGKYAYSWYDSAEVASDAGLTSHL
jgi:homogentisate 1,2-dioxygenase